MIYALKILPREFYNRKTLTIAQDLLGKFLVRKIGKKIISAMITETEAYCGPNDLASHASRGKTPRTEIMFGEPGRVYIYMIYGMYYCLNVVTEKKDYPAAVLIRGVKVDGVDYKITNGPGKLCKFLKIDTTLNGVDISRNTSPSPGLRPPSPARRGGKLLLSSLSLDGRGAGVRVGRRGGVNTLWIENQGIKIKLPQILRTPRIGIDYAGKYKDKKWRFLLI